MDVVKNIAILGGTFDPIHLGHLMVAAVVLEKLAAANVVFMPAGHPWIKNGNQVSPADDRLAMVQLAVEGKPGMSVSTIEIERPGPTYTVDTLREYRKKLTEQQELFFILGWDNLLALPRWRNPEELVSLCRLIAVPRIGYRVPDESTLEAIIPGLSRRVILVDKPEVDISASVIRERARKGLSLKHLVPATVEQYIRDKGLYR
jgi:nicotinate-nucleotide adenylyltransferase